MSKDNGGPAFPGKRVVKDAAWEGSRDVFTDGMTLRDYFAAKATEEDIQYQIRKLAPRNGFGEVMESSLCRSHARYAHADSMLEARK